MLFEELRNSAAFKSYHILKLGSLVEFLMKKDVKIEFSNVLSIFEQFLESKSR